MKRLGDLNLQHAHTEHRCIANAVIPPTVTASLPQSERRCVETRTNSIGGPVEEGILTFNLTVGGPMTLEQRRAIVDLARDGLAALAAFSQSSCRATYYVHRVQG